MILSKSSLMNLMSHSIHLRYSCPSSRKQPGNNLPWQSQRRKTILLPSLEKEEEAHQSRQGRAAAVGQRLAPPVLVKEVLKVREEVKCMAHRLIHLAMDVHYNIRNKKGLRRRSEIHLRTTIIAKVPQLVVQLMALGKAMTKLQIQSKRSQGSKARERGRGRVSGTGTRQGTGQEAGALSQLSMTRMEGE